MISNMKTLIILLTTLLLFSVSTFATEEVVQSTTTPESEIPLKILEAGKSDTQSATGQKAIFTFAIKQGHKDKVACSSPNDFRLFLGTLRRVYDGDIVLAVESSNLTPDVIEIL